MRSIRVIPTLLIRDSGLVKSICFAKHRYVGDPINAVRIFNEKEVDELVILDIDATRRSNSPNFSLVRDVASECFMPLCYGGGVRTHQAVEKLLNLGVEKIAVNSALYDAPEFVKEAAKAHGSSTIVASIDFQKGFFGKSRVVSHSGSRKQGVALLDAAKRAEDLGCGEIMLTAIDRDGTMSGYDIEATRAVAEAVSVPVIASGGAGEMRHLSEAVQQGKASAVAAGSMFVFHGRHRAVLITYPSQAELRAAGLSSV